MKREIAEKVKEAGVVGAGGAGFPTHIKLSSPAEIVIANGAECEPLLWKDKELMRYHPEEVVEGLKLAMEAVGANKGYIAIKARYESIIKKLKPHITPGIEIYPLSNFYPAGDEVELVYEITGRVIPPGGIPPDVDVVVQNVETLYNIKRAVDGIPVYEKWVSVVGDVEKPLTLKVPVGTPAKEIICLARPIPKRYAIIEGGPMTGKIVDEDEPVKKTTAGFVVLSKNHYLVRKRERPETAVFKITQFCTQCTRCTDLCPRHLLGHPIEPHRIMRSVGYNLIKGETIRDVFYCCECSLCEFFSCPVDLSPKTIISSLKAHLVDEGIRPEKKKGGRVDVEKKGRRVPLSRLLERIGLSKFNVRAPFLDIEISPREVIIPKIHGSGKPGQVVVRQGERVKKGTLLVEFKQGIGARVHASIDGIVEDTKGRIRIRKA